MTDQVLDPGFPLPLAPEGGAGSPAPASRGRRFVLSALLVLTAALLLFATWYLVTRKPISEIPGIDIEATPAYTFSVFGASSPLGVAVNRDGSRIYVTESAGERRTLLFDPAGNQLAILVPPAETGTDHLPIYVAVSPATDEVFVADRMTGAIYVYAADGVFSRVFDPGEALAGWQPLGIGFAADGTMLVADVARGAAHEFAPDGSFLRTLGGDGSFSFPNGTAFDSKGRMYVADGNNGRLLVFSPDGAEIATVRRGAAKEELGLPRGVAVDDDGRIYVVDAFAHGVQEYRLQEGARTPKFVGHFGIQGVGDGEFQYPNGLAVDGRGRVYVTDRLNNRIQVWSN